MSILLDFFKKKKFYVSWLFDMEASWGLNKPQISFCVCTCFSQVKSIALAMTLLGNFHALQSPNHVAYTFLKIVISRHKYALENARLLTECFKRIDFENRNLKWFLHISSTWVDFTLIYTYLVLPFCRKLLIKKERISKWSCKGDASLLNNKTTYLNKILICKLRILFKIKKELREINVFINIDETNLEKYLNTIKSHSNFVRGSTLPLEKSDDLMWIKFELGFILTKILFSTLYCVGFSPDVSITENNIFG